MNLETMGEKAQVASRKLAQLTTEEKNQALRSMAQALEDHTENIIAANQRDLKAAVGLKASFVDRLTLDRARIVGMADGLRQLARLADPIGDVVDAWTTPTGLEIAKRRVPLGVIGMIFEARPNVSVDASGLCFKSGNAVILRGGKEALQTNQMLVKVLRRVLADHGLDPNAIQLIEDASHEVANQFMQLTEYLDVLIPRGSARLINAVAQQATVPVIKTGAGNCHIYVDDDADLAMAIDVVVNAKVQRPSVCNAAEKLLINSAVASEYLPAIAQALIDQKVELRGDKRAQAILGDQVNPATSEDWDTEYNDYIMAIKVVDTLDEAISHINQHNTQHSEAIITNNYANSQRFLAEVDAAAVYVNASTRFTDGSEFGFGAEIGISTQKLHARGPMGLKELTTTKYVIRGDGQVRK